MQSQTELIPLIEVIATRIRHFRRMEDNMSVRALAEACQSWGVSSLTQASLTNIERMRRSITVEELLSVAHVLKVPPLELLLPAGELLVDVVPGHLLTRDAAAKWLTGRSSKWAQEGQSEIDLLSQHGALTADWRWIMKVQEEGSAKSRHVETWLESIARELWKVRQQMRSQSLALPRLPEELDVLDFDFTNGDISAQVLPEGVQLEPENG